MNQKIKITIWLVASIITIGIIGKIIISNNPVYKFKVDSLFESKECTITSYSLLDVKEDIYCSNKVIRKYLAIITKEELSTSGIMKKEVDECKSEVNFDRKVEFKGETDCYRDTYFDFLIFRTTDNKVISKGYITANSTGFSENVNTSIEDSCYFSLCTIGSGCTDDKYQVLFK